MSDTLVLSPDLTPMNQVPWTRALSLFVQGEVEILEEYADWVVRTVSRAFKVPSVVRFLKGAEGWRKSGIRFSRDNVYLRDKGRCAYCNVDVPRSDFTFDHVTPRSSGGTTRWENVVVACLTCNQKKGNRTPAQAGLQLHRKPHKPRSLPQVHAGQMRVPLDAPESWRTYLSAAYWHTELVD